ncbi:MAG: hypothetical protein QXP42_04910 [Candidatus Micrarchaeia archaeon]
MEHVKSRCDICGKVYLPYVRSRLIISPHRICTCKTPENMINLWNGFIKWDIPDNEIRRILAVVGLNQYYVEEFVTWVRISRGEYAVMKE